MSPTSERDIVVLGAGVIGLYVAHVLAQQAHGHRVSVVAEYLPGDTAPSYTSPWAGCNFSAISGSDANALRWDRAGYAFLRQVASRSGKEAFVKETPSIEFWDEVVPRGKIKTMSQYLEHFEEVPQAELPDGVTFGASYTTVTINAPKFLQYLKKELAEKFNVHFVRQKLDHIHAAYGPATRVVFNCTGNAARTLPGVADSKCYPTRGQVVLVRAPGVQRNEMRHGNGYETYVIPRPGTDGHAILGGYMQKGIDDAATYASETQSILERTSALCAGLRTGEPEVLGIVAGMRPSREGGARVEKEEVEIAGQKRLLVHNYGAGGTGFQAGYGMAQEAVNLVADALEPTTRSRL